jgi:hypothetical protein
LAPLAVLGQLLVVWSSGSPVHPNAGLLVFAVLLYGLARGVGLAWVVLVAWNAVMLAFVLPAFGGGLAGGVALAYHASSLLLLFSGGIRRQVGFASGRPHGVA